MSFRTTALLSALLACSALAAAGSEEPHGAPAGALAQGAPPASAPQGGAPQGGTPQQMPWPVLLGVRVASVEQRIPIMDRVVLVPDEATFLDEISRWSTKAQWPVLIEDSRWAPLFVRGFKPSQVVRRTAPAPSLPTDAAGRRKALLAAVTRAWGGNPTTMDPAAAFTAVGLKPAGLVLASTDDPAWTAAVALAAGRGEPLDFLDGTYGNPQDTLNGEVFAALNRAVEDGFKRSGFTYASVGDELDACTICRTIGSKCTPNLPASQRFNIQGAPPTNPQEPLATTDCLCRGSDGKRFAMCGWIFGDSARAAYMAMCSMFLHRQSIAYVNSYPETGNYQPFGVGDIQQVFETAGYKISLYTSSTANLRGWHRMSVGGFTPDVLFLNSSGNCDFFDLGEPGRAPPEDRASWLDVPLLTRPLAAHVIHSFSMQWPNFENSVGARWLDHGAYAYVGSVQEPFLGAFVPPRVVTDRVVNFTPFLVAARQWDGPLAAPWRIITIGDPLMLVAPPARLVRARVAVADDAGDAARLSDLRASATELLKLCQSQPNSENFAKCFTELEKQGDDRIAAKLWTIAVSNGVLNDTAPNKAGVPGGSAVARAALGALFRAKDGDGFTLAFQKIANPDGEALDMLWGLYTPRLTTIDSREIVEMLGKHPRAIRPDVDLIRVAAAYGRVISADAARTLLVNAAERCKDQQAQQAMRAAALGY